MTVKKLVESGSLSDLPLKADTISDLKALCMALLDNLNDKNLALSHQKKTNRLLGAKIGDLEHRVRLLSNDKSTAALLSPSQILLNGYTSSKVDRDLKITKDPDDPAVALRNYNMDHFSTDSTRSMISSEYGEKSSDISSEYNQNFLHHINIIENDDLETIDDEDDTATVTCEKLEELPPEIAKLMEEALRNSREADDLHESGDDR